jgi:hypothetical protein
VLKDEKPKPKTSPPPKAKATAKTKPYKDEDSDEDSGEALDEESDEDSAEDDAMEKFVVKKPSKAKPKILVLKKAVQAPGAKKAAKIPYQREERKAAPKKTSISPVQFITKGSLIIVNPPTLKHSDRVVGFDMDSTLIETQYVFFLTLCDGRPH